MSENTKIEWCDSTINGWWGCTKVSEGCANCYAESLDHLRGGNFDEGRKHWGKGVPRWNKIEGARREALALDRKAKRLGRRYRVFGNSMNDWLDDEVSPEWLRDFLWIIRATPNIDWLLLTKRPGQFDQRIDEASCCIEGDDEGMAFYQWVQDWLMGGRPPANVWVGTTCENQKRADERIPKLLEIPATVRFLSCEPLLGPIRFSKVPGFNSLSPENIEAIRQLWIIAGGESGPKARPMHPDWARSIRDQCQAAGVPFLFKQWGEYSYDIDNPTPTLTPGEDCYDMKRVGKKAAGRLLDGREWNEFPKGGAK